MNKIKSERGSALLIALCLMGMLTLVAMTAMKNSNTDMELSFNQENSERSFYIAEAGAKRAVAEIKADTTWRTGFTGIGFNGGTYTVQVTDSTTNAALGDTILITSVGDIMNATSEVEILLAPDVNYPFRYAMFAKNSIDIRNSMETDSYNSDSGSYFATQSNTDGDIGSNGAIDIHNGATIAGDASTSLDGGLTLVNRADVLGDTTSTAPEQDVPDIPASEFTWAESVSIASTGISGSYTYDPATKAFETSNTVVLDDGVYFFSSIILKNSASLQVATGAQVTIYVTGDIELKNSAEVNPGGVPSDLMIFSQGDFVLKNSGDIYGTFYSTSGLADLRNSGEFYGSIVAEDIIAHNSAKFHYDRELANYKKGSSSEMLVVGWRENF
ncbi:MAG: pilus assembly PilX N-terminal domain-containing protein [candidate division Zixibacteria bacterium]|nr:pilus assembly PilX N-terminal domain-containing protein [candidate division Zixibacteria bacterium]